MSTDQIQVFRIDGVGGLLVRQTDGVECVLRFLLPSGEHLNIALNTDQLRALATVLHDLQVAEIETGQVLRDLGLYRQG